MFGLKKVYGENSVDFSQPLQRVLNNPLNTTTEAKPTSPHELKNILSAIESSFYVIDQIRETVAEAAELALRAKDIEEIAGRALLAEQFDELRQSVENTLKLADEDAQKLLGPAAKPLSGILNQHSKYTVDPACLDLSDAGLGLPPPVEAFASTAEIARTLKALDLALAKIDLVSADYMKDTQFLAARLEKNADAC